MSAFIKAPFGDLAPILAELGYLPVPIKPGFKASMLDDWQAGHPPGHYLPKCPTWGTGILTATCPAIDLDIRDRELVRALIQIADDLLGGTAFRIGSRPKALLPFSTGTPFEKISGRWFAVPGDDWRAEAYAPHRIEILGDGQQFLAYARHPRGTFYRWARGEPMCTHRVDLPEVDQAAAQSFLWSAQATIREAGAVTLVRRDKIWFPDVWAPGDFGESEPTKDRRQSLTGERVDCGWQRLDPEKLAKTINAKHAQRLKGDGWITSCPAHRSDGHRSLSITPRDGGGSVVHCFGGCGFVELAREITSIVGKAA